MPNEPHTGTADAPSVNLGLFDVQGPQSGTSALPEASDPEAVLDAYMAVLRAHDLNPPPRIRFVDALQTVKTGTPVGVGVPAKRRAEKRPDSAFRLEADRIRRTANAPKVAPGQSWTDGSGAVRYTSWAWIPETNRQSYALAVALGIYATDERGKTRYVGEDHLYGLDDPSHPLHDTWLRERRTYLALVGVADEHTSHL